MCVLTGHAGHFVNYGSLPALATVLIPTISGQLRSEKSY